MPRRRRASSSSPDRAEGPGTSAHKTRRLGTPVLSEAIVEDVVTDLKLEPDEIRTIKPTVVIDHAYFPHIMDNILRGVSIETLLSFRATSSVYRDRIDKDLAHITIAICGAFKAQCPSTFYCTGRVFAETARGYILWSFPLHRTVSHPHIRSTSHLISHQPSIIPEAIATFSTYARFHSTRNVTVTIDFIGDTDEATGGTMAAIFSGALTDGEKSVNRPSPRTRFRLFPDSNGIVGGSGHSWDGPRILMDSWKTKRTSPDDWRHKDFVISISGRECTRLKNAGLPGAGIPKGSTVVYDFNNWKPLAPDCACAGSPNSKANSENANSERQRCPLAKIMRDVENPMMDSFISDIVYFLSLECVVYIFGIQRVDREWLDPYYVSGKGWTRVPHGSKPGGKQTPLHTYIRDAVIALLDIDGLEDVVEDIDLYLQFLGLRYSWQTYCDW